MMPNCDEEGAEAFNDRIRAELEENRFTVNGKTLRYSLRTAAVVSRGRRTSLNRMFEISELAIDAANNEKLSFSIYDHNGFRKEHQQGESDDGACLLSK